MIMSLLVLRVLYLLFDSPFKSTSPANESESAEKLTGAGVV
jgi:hypothetical protein